MAAYPLYYVGMEETIRRGLVVDVNIRMPSTPGVPVIHTVEVLGGPVSLRWPNSSSSSAQDFYTVYDPADERTRLVSAFAIRAALLNEAWRDTPSPPVEGYCPSCDEPEMLFYNDDYLCCLCRDILMGDG